MRDPIRDFEHAAWQRAAPHYAAGFGRATAPFVAPLLDAAAVRPGTRLLDLCCGLGVAAEGGLARGARVCGADFSAGMLAAARARLPAASLVLADAAQLPWPAAAFDAAVSNFGVHHIPDPVAVLREARRVLAPGGRFAFTVWAAPAENAAWRLLLDAVRQHGVAAPAAPPPQGGFNRPEHCTEALDAAGFTGAVAVLHHAVWPLADAAALIAAFREGTARMAAVIAAQPPEALRRIAETIAESAAPFRTPQGLAIPIAALVAHGRQPTAPPRP